MIASSLAFIAKNLIYCFFGSFEVEYNGGLKWKERERLTQLFSLIKIIVIYSLLFESYKVINIVKKDFTEEILIIVLYK